jgi:hypothetical protein
MQFPQPPVMSPVLDPDTTLSTLLLYTFSFFFPYGRESQVLPTYKAGLSTPGSFPWGGGVKRPGHEAIRSPPSTAEVNNAWSYTSTPPYFCMMWCVVKHQAQSLPFRWDTGRLISIAGYNAMYR